jgi:F0F1-type ATP synthase assembly protein I
LRPPEDLSYIVQIFTSEDDVVAEGPERSRGEVSKGFDDGLSKAFELALTPAVLGVGGWLLDTRIGTTPLFTLVLSLLGVLGTSLSLWYRYDAAMKAQEAAVAEARAARPPRRRMARTAGHGVDAAPFGAADPATTGDPAAARQDQTA